MKTLCLLLTMAPLFSFSQTRSEWKDWKIDGRKSLVWQHVYEDSSTSAKAIIEMLKTHSWIAEIEESESVIYATAQDYIVDLDKYSNNWGVESFYEVGRWNMAIRIDLKPGRYRVTVTSLRYHVGFDKKEYTNINVPLVGNIEGDVLARDRSHIRTNQLHALEIFSRDLYNRFDLKGMTVFTSDW